MKTKQCKKCDRTLPFDADHFPKEGRNKSGLSGTCRGCVREQHKKWVKDNPKRHSEQSQRKHRKYYIENQQTILEKAKVKNATSSKKAKNSAYARHRRLTDPCYKLKSNISRAIRSALLREHESKRGASTFDHLPYTPEQLKEHLQAQFDAHMTWDNYGDYWHIDHIHPQSLLPYDTLEHPNFHKCWSLSNLQPLEAIENIKKSNKLLP